jgi:hypothetical protein
MIEPKDTTTPAVDTKPTAPDKPEKPLSPEEQMERFEEDLKENDWGHQPC